MLLGDIVIKLQTLYQFSNCNHNKFIKAVEYIESLDISNSTKIEEVVAEIAEIMFGFRTSYGEISGFTKDNVKIISKYNLISKTRLEFFDDTLFRSILKSYKEKFNPDEKNMELEIKLKFSDWKDLFALKHSDPIYPNIINCFENIIKDIHVWLKYNSFIYYKGLYLDRDCNIIIIFSSIK